MASTATERSASALAHEWIASLESALEGVKAELNTLTRALGTRAAAGSGADAVALSKRLCENAVTLRTKNDKFVAFMKTAPPPLEILDAVEKALDARDAALDAFENALQRKCGIAPVGISEPESSSLEGGNSAMRSRAIIGLARRAGASRPAPSAVTAAAVDSAKEWSVPVSTPARPRTPSPPPVREQSLPATPTLADFGISEDALDGIMNPTMKFPLGGLGTTRSSKTTASAAPSSHSEIAHTSSVHADVPAGGLGGGWRGATGEASAISGVSSMYGMGTRSAIVEDTSPALENTELEEDENDQTYDETVEKAMERLGIETPNAIKGRFAARSPIRFALRGLDGSPLYSEETPRVQTRKSGPHRAVMEGYDQLPDFVKSQIDQQALLRACEAVESGGPGKVYAAEEMNTVFKKAVPHVAPSYVVLALTKLKVIALQRGEKTGEQVYHLVV